MIAWYWSVVAFILGIVFATVSWNAVERDNILSAICAWLAIPFVYVAMFPITFWKNTFEEIAF